MHQALIDETIEAGKVQPDHGQRLFPMKAFDMHLSFFINLHPEVREEVLRANRSLVLNGRRLRVGLLLRQLHGSSGGRQPLVKELLQLCGSCGVFS